MEIIFAKGSLKEARPSAYGKQLHVQRLYTKGKSFIAASLLLRKSGGNQYVVLHLLCQGVEIVLKAMLLLRNYDRYKPQLRVRKRKGIGHNLARLLKVVTREFSLKPIGKQLATELKLLNILYKNHRLRYESIVDVFVDPQSIPSGLILRKTYAAMRLCDKSHANDEKEG